VVAPSKEEALSILRDGQERLDELLAKLSDEDLVKPATIGNRDWSAKDVIGHVALWEEVALVTLEAWLEGQQAPVEETFGGGDVDEINARNHERKRAWPLERIRSESALAHRRLINAMDGLDEEAWRSVLPFQPEGKDRTLGEQLGTVLAAPGRPFGHVFAHLPDLEAYVRSIGA
jgi:hypothetical protein